MSFVTSANSAGVMTSILVAQSRQPNESSGLSNDQKIRLLKRDQKLIGFIIDYLAFQKKAEILQSEIYRKYHDNMDQPISNKLYARLKRFREERIIIQERYLSLTAENYEDSSAPRLDRLSRAVVKLEMELSQYGSPIFDKYKNGLMNMDAWDTIYDKIGDAIDDLEELEEGTRLGADEDWDEEDVEPADLSDRPIHPPPPIERREIPLQEDREEEIPLVPLVPVKPEGNEVEERVGGAAVGAIIPEEDVAPEDRVRLPWDSKRIRGPFARFSEPVTRDKLINEIIPEQLRTGFTGWMNHQVSRIRKTNPDYAGRLIIMLKINPYGEVVNGEVLAEQSSLDLFEDVAEEANQKLMKLKFPPLLIDQGNDPIEVILPIDFTQSF